MDCKFGIVGGGCWKSVLAAVCLLAAGCASGPELPEPIRVIENPYKEDQMDRLTKQYLRNNEYWRTDAEAVTQVEIYKIEGKNAVILEQIPVVAKLQEAEILVTTLKNRYRFNLIRKGRQQQAWWVERIEVYKLPSQVPAANPALTQPPVKQMRDPMSLDPLDSDGGPPPNP